MSVLFALPRTVIVLGFASFFTDFSGEMIYPLLPVFLSTVLGAGAIQLGVIEGVAESTASLLKVIAGFWTDRLRRRRPFVIWGYTLAGAVRPLIGLASQWPFVLFLRLADRIGKGLRTSPRDAMIADVTASGQRGAAYGFHRAMDHAGAVVGPLVAAALIHWGGFSLRRVFLTAVIPAAVVVLLLGVLLQESPLEIPAQLDSPSPSKSFWQFSPAYRHYLVALFIFTLGSSSDAFLLLRLSAAGLTSAGIAVIWSIHNGLKMVGTYSGGLLADRYPSRWQILSAWAVYALVYAGFGLVTSKTFLVALFFIYALYYGLVEPAERVLVAQLAPAHTRGTAFGYFHGTEGLAALPASLIFGFIWKQWGMAPAFFTGAACSGIASLWFAFALRRTDRA